MTVLSLRPVHPWVGGCPHCRGYDAVRNIEREHWAYCARHQVKWCLGDNILSAWRDETSVHWAKNEAFLSLFREVQEVSGAPVEPAVVAIRMLTPELDAVETRAARAERAALLRAVRRSRRTPEIIDERYT